LEGEERKVSKEREDELTEELINGGTKWKEANL
jgi:hypothetical protein